MKTYEDKMLERKLCPTCVIKLLDGICPYCAVDWFVIEQGMQEEEEKVTEHCRPKCPRCQGNLKTIEVHGHIQCAICGSVVDDCCQGRPMYTSKSLDV
jgi:hypothetical protein